MDRDIYPFDGSVTDAGVDFHTAQKVYHQPVCTF